MNPFDQADVQQKSIKFFSTLLLLYVWIKWKLFFCLCTCLVRKNLFLFGGCVFSSKGCKVLLKQVYKKNHWKNWQQKKKHQQKRTCAVGHHFFLLVSKGKGIMLRLNTVVPSESQTTLISCLSLSSNLNGSNLQLDKSRESEGPETELKLVEIPNVFSDETSLSVVGVVIQFL